ncbi:vwkA [Symbiodinium microadriaticum]|nr:vwkA [Symbiodinium microadriaticum]CAE7940707.1 vwkA [Symbiodinium sp. KB8]
MASKLAALSRELSGLTEEQIASLLLSTMDTHQHERLLARAAQAKKAESRLDSEISESHGRAKEAKTLDAVFVIDCTGSMDEQIAHAKETVASIQRDIYRLLGAGGSVRLAVVGFRDYNDQDRVEVLPFTKDVQEVEKFLAKLTAKGGDDGCEDVVGGIEAALKLSWTARTRVMYLLCDYPSHGARFYDEEDENSVSEEDENSVSEEDDNWDQHPDDPKQWQPTDELLAKSVELRINLVCLDYGLCSKMFGIFKELREQRATTNHNLQTIVYQSDHTAENFVRCVLRSTSKSLRSSLGNSSSRAAHVPQAALQLDEHPEISWKDFKDWKCHQVLVTALTVSGLHVAPKQNGTVQRFYVRAEPFASGNMRWAFPAANEEGLRYVLKVQKADPKEAKALCFQDVETQAYAKIFAVEFSRLVPEAPLQFVDSWVVHLPKWEVAKHATIELFIEGKYEKYTSNNGFSSPGALLAETFSHFTWQYSGGNMQVTDLQGVNCSVLTDPQIHCAKEDAFSRGNLGKRGMDNFFLSHCCNDLCRKLCLKQSPMQPGFDCISDLCPAGVGEDALSDVESVISSYSTASRLLSCELCMAQVCAGTKHQLDTLEKYNAVWCQECLRKAVEALVETKCLSCKKPFSYSFYAIKFKGCVAPATCEDCERGENWMLI